MSNLAHRQEKIQEKRKQTPWREFVMEICSWQPCVIQKYQGQVSRYPESTNRVGNILGTKEYNQKYVEGAELGNKEFQMNFSFSIQNLELRKDTIKSSGFQYSNTNENSERAETIFGCKNAYLSLIVGDGAENILYSMMSYTNTRNILNSVYAVINCENIYSCKTIRESFNIFFSKYIYNSSNIWFSNNLVGCTECIKCDHLENQSYCIENNQYEKDEYFQKKKEILSNKNVFELYYSDISNISPNKICTKSSGSGLFQCENVNYGFDTSNVKNANNIIFSDGGAGSSECFDCFDVGLDAHYLYAVTGQGNGSHNYCSILSNFNNNIYYCYGLDHCNFCLGCVGLRNKSYCILNKQYSKEERYEKVDEIFSQMEKDGTLGQFFSATMNPFYFNDTAAYLIDPSFTKEEVTAKGYLWRDEPIRVDIPAGATVVKINELANYEGRIDDPQSANQEFANQKWYINPEILNVIIQDEQGNVYKIVKMEYDFLMKHGLPLPRKHWLERMKENFRIN